MFQYTLKIFITLIVIFASPSFANEGLSFDSAEAHMKLLKAKVKQNSGTHFEFLSQHQNGAGSALRNRITSALPLHCGHVKIGSVEGNGNRDSVILTGDIIIAANCNN